MRLILRAWRLAGDGRRIRTWGTLASGVAFAAIFAALGGIDLHRGGSQSLWSLIPSTVVLSLAMAFIMDPLRAATALMPTMQAAIRRSILLPGAVLLGVTAVIGIAESALRGSPTDTLTAVAITVLAGGLLRMCLTDHFLFVIPFLVTTMAFGAEWRKGVTLYAGPVALPLLIAGAGVFFAILAGHLLRRMAFIRPAVQPRYPRSEGHFLDLLWRPRAIHSLPALLWSRVAHRLPGDAARGLLMGTVMLLVGTSMALLPMFVAGTIFWTSGQRDPRRLRHEVLYPGSWTRWTLSWLLEPLLPAVAALVGCFAGGLLLFQVGIGLDLVQVRPSVWILVAGELALALGAGPLIRLLGQAIPLVLVLLTVAMMILSAAIRDLDDHVIVAIAAGMGVAGIACFALSWRLWTTMDESRFLRSTA